MVLGHDLSRGQRTEDVKISENVSFDTMLLDDVTLKGLRKAGFSKPSPIQLRGIPLGKCGFDLLLEAKSGTGKTAVFVVVALEKLDLTKGVQTIILAPTREIASQICDVVSIIGAYYQGLKVAVVMGGLPVKDDIEKFKRDVHIVVGSPGRLRHLIQFNHIDVSTVRLLVLDEADKLMEPSFLRDINYIFSILPKQKQVIMSSATYETDTKTFIGKYVKKSQHVCPDSNSVLLGIEQKFIIVPYNSNISKRTKYKYEELKKILSSKQFKQCLIFCNYQIRVAQVHRLLTQDKWPSEQLYGLQDQHERLGALKTLQEYKCRILVSTDLAARGIDASNVDLVVNFEPPFEWQTYLHRIGRAGRYGSYGVAISILCDGEEKSKFKSTLTHTNISFNLTNFWTDEPLNMDTTEVSIDDNTNNILKSSATKSLTASVNNVSFFEDFTVESNDQKDEIKQEILCFEELCDSFNNYVIDNEDEPRDEKQKLKYKHLKISKEYMKFDNFPHKICDYSKSTFVDQNYDEDSSSVEEELINGTGLQKNCISNETEVASDKKSNCSENYKQLNSVDTQVSYENDNQASNFTNNSAEPEYDATEQALIEAGLPIAFGKPKQNQKKKSKRHSKYHCETDIEKKNREPTDQKIYKNNQHVYDKEITRMEHHILAKTKKSYDQHSVSTNDIFHSTSESVDESDESDSFNTNYQNHIVRNSRSMQKTSTYLNNKLFIKNFPTEIPGDSKVKRRSKQFDNWYKELRVQSQFIQYTMYLEEIKKL